MWRGGVGVESVWRGSEGGGVEGGVGVESEWGGVEGDVEGE